MDSQQRKYRGFISYSHANADIANWLHKRLERYKAPLKDLDKTRRKLSPIFLDRDELPTSSDLGEKLRNALVNSESLIVICSPASARSKWVNEEVRSFKTLHPERHVLGLIVDGEPYAGDERECFPEAMRFQVDSSGRITETPAEPLAADIRKGKDVKFDALLKIAAGILGTGLDQLKQREKRRRRRQSLLVGGLVLAVLAGTGIAGQQILEREQQARMEQARADAEARRARNEERNRIAALTHTTLETGTTDEALDIILSAIDEDAASNTDEVSKPVLKALERVLNLADGGLRVRQFESGVAQINLLPNDSLFVRLDSGRLVVMDAQSGVIKREIEAFGYPKVSGRFLFQYTVEDTLSEASDTTYTFTVVRTDLQTGERQESGFETTSFYSYNPDFSPDGLTMTASCAQVNSCIALVDWMTGNIVAQRPIGQDTGFGNSLIFLDSETLLHAYKTDDQHRIATWSPGRETYQFELDSTTQFDCDGESIAATEGDVYFRKGWLAWGLDVPGGYCAKVWAPGQVANAAVVDLEFVNLIAPTDEGGLIFQTSENYDTRWHVPAGDGSLHELSRCSGLDTFNIDLLSVHQLNAQLLSNDVFTCEGFPDVTLYTRSDLNRGRAITGHGSRITGALVRPSTNELLTVGSDGELRRTPMTPQSVTIDSGRHNRLVASETHIAFELEDRRIQILNVDGEPTAISLPIERAEQRIYDFVADGRVLAVLDYDPIPLMWIEESPPNFDDKAAVLTLIDSNTGATIGQRSDIRLTSDVFELDEYLTLSGDGMRALLGLRDFQSFDEIDLLDGRTLQSFRREEPIEQISAAYDDHSIWFAVTYPAVEEYLYPTAIEQWIDGELVVRETRRGYAPSLITAPDSRGAFIVMQEHWDVKDSLEHGLFFYRDDEKIKISDDDHMSALLGVVHVDGGRLYDRQEFGDTLEMFDVETRSKSTLLPDLQSFEEGFTAKIDGSVRKIVLTNSGLFWLDGENPIPVCQGLATSSANIEASSPRSSHIVLQAFGGVLYDLATCSIVMDLEALNLDILFGAVIQNDQIAWIATANGDGWARIEFNKTAETLIEQAVTIKSYRSN